MEKQDYAQQIIGLIEQYKNELIRLKYREPYHFNLIEEFHINENAHTRILMKLLQYEEQGNYTILESFLHLIYTIFKVHTSCQEGNPRITINKELIDGLIEYPKREAFIIENKIQNAKDENTQIERYYNAVKAHGVPQESIYVIYLTADGTKQVSEISLTPYVKEALGERFLKMNYKHHILPWLKDVVLPNLRRKEQLLITAIEQYIDYLQGRFYARDYQIEKIRKMEKTLVDYLKLEGKSTSEKMAILNDYSQSTREMLVVMESIQKKIQKESFKSFIELSKDKECLGDDYEVEELITEWRCLKFF